MKNEKTTKLEMQHFPFLSAAARLLVGVMALGAVACGGNAAPKTGGDDGIVLTAPNVQLSQPMQKIDGFGINTAWLSPPSDAATRAQVYDVLFSVTNGVGLSMIRHRIPFRENSKYDDKFVKKNADGTYQATVNADGTKTFALDWSNWDLGNIAHLVAEIKAKGADYDVRKLISSPWTPPNNSVSMWKVADAITSSVDYVNAPEVGGSLATSFYADYADLLADYALGYAAHMGTELTALSLQNEPNFKCNYESANWTPAQIHDFLAVLNAEFTKKGVFTALPQLKVLAPEYQNVKEDLVGPALDDPATAAVLGIVGVHQYEYGKGRSDNYTVPVLSKSLGLSKPVWMTEWSTAEWGADPSMANGLILANLIHMDLTVGQMSAFVYWWGWGDGKNTLLVVDGTTITVPKRAHVLAQWSRFVRPDYVRIQATAKPTPGVLLSAFKNPAGDQVVLVAVNAGGDEVSLPLWIDTGGFGPLTMYRTSAGADENVSNVGTIDGGSMVKVKLPATSVTTLVGPLTR